MQGTAADRPTSLIDTIERVGIATVLGLMTLVTFANVVARYVFNSNVLWALETTVFLFAWLVLLGASHGVKISAHIGVDLILNLLPAGLRKAMILLTVGLCLTFSILLLIGAFQYWWPFATKQSWYEVNDIPMFFFPGLMADLFNYGEEYEKMPRFIPYAVLPLGLFLLTLRFLQAGWEIMTDRRHMLIASHEAETEDMAAQMALETGDSETNAPPSPSRDREG